MGNELVLHVVVPQVVLSQVTQQVIVHNLREQKQQIGDSTTSGMDVDSSAHLELSRQNSSGVDVARVGLDTLVVS